MNILVCVKQVPDGEQITVSEDAQGRALLGEFSELRMNRFDEFAVEEAMRLKETAPAVSVDALTMGPAAALAVVRRAVGMGADRGVHLQTEDSENAGPAVVAAAIAHYAQPKAYGLVLFGSMSEDGMHAQVGPMTAGRLRRPYATQVIDLQLAADQRAVTVEREVEGGGRERLRVQLPAVLSLQPGINRPRYPSLSNLLRANRQEMEIVAVGAAAGRAAATVCRELVLPPRKRAGQVLDGTLEEMAEQLVSILTQKGFVR